MSRVSSMAGVGTHLDVDIGNVRKTHWSMKELTTLNDDDDQFAFCKVNDQPLRDDDEKKMHFLLSSMSVVYVLTTPIPEDDGDDATMEQIRKRNKDVIFDENRFSSVHRPSQKSLVKGIEDSGGLVVPEKVTKEVEMTKEFLSSRFSMKDIEESDVILGIRIKHKSNGIEISQFHYIEKYSRVICCLMYAMTCTRLDIAFAVGKLSRYTSNPSTQHWQAIQQSFTMNEDEAEFSICKVRDAASALDDSSSEENEVLFENGNSFKPVPRTTANADGTSTSTIPGPVTTEEKAQKKNDVKARSITNEVDTASIQVSAVSTPVSTVSSHDNTANLSDALSVSFVEHQSKKVLSENWPRNQDSLRKTVIVEDTSSKVMVAIDGAGFDWSYMADDEVPTNMALIAFSDSEFNKSEFDLATYKRGLASVEEQLVFYKKNEIPQMRLRKLLMPPIIEDWVSDSDEDESEEMVLNLIMNFAPTAVLTKSGIVPISTTRQSSSRVAAPVSDARPTNTVSSKPQVNVTKPRQNDLQTTHSLSRSPFYQQTALKNRNFNNNVNAAKANSVNTAKGNKVTSFVGNQGINVVKSSACWVWRPKIKVQDHVSKNSGSYICKRFNYGAPQDALKDQGYFDSGCSKHMTGNISCLTDFKEHDEGYVAFEEGAKGGKINGKDTIRMGKLDFEDVYFVKELQFNLFSVSQICDKKNSVLFTDIECFVLSPNFKLADASQVLLKVPRKNKIIMHKNYCLVITDDFSIFTWVFFLATKDESSRIPKSFITKIENLVEKKVKIIRCDNGIEFKNRVMNEFYEEKGIKREYSMARTPQQNRVAERKNRTLIKAARTMLANSKLPTKFWAEAVSTACYVQNRVLVVKPHFKTLYELFNGRSPALSFMRPFGCHVLILNTLDQLEKFDGKLNEEIFVGYSTTSKAFRVYNIKTKKVEKNLHITFLKNKPMIAGGGPKWLFDIDALSKLMNYAPVSAGKRKTRKGQNRDKTGKKGK
nr:ribonuclease H-like domain-containing protein [Tanacetum cinerariifolium]